MEAPCFDVYGWPLFADEVADVAEIIGSKPASLKRVPARPLAVWRRFGGKLPCITRSLDAALVAGFSRSMGRQLIDYVTPAVWISRTEKENPIYGSSYPCSGGGPRKGGMRTAHVIGEAPSNVERTQERFVAQCISDYCTEGTLDRLEDVHGYDCMKIADIGWSRVPRLPEYYDTCAARCDLCRDEFSADGYSRKPTTWRRLLHRAEMFLSQWELVRVEGLEPFETGVNWRDLGFWPLVDYSDQAEGA